jgi:hypothetical protein
MHSFGDIIFNVLLRHTGYLYQKDSLKICFSKYDSGEPEAPPLPPKKGQIPHESFKLGSINIINSSDDIEIIINKSNSDYFDLIESCIDSVKLLYFYKVIDVYVNTKKDDISSLVKNKKQILNAGLPFWVFMTNTFQISIGGANDYIPLSFFSRFIDLFQKIITLLIYMPLIGELYLFLKIKMTNENLNNYA